MGLFEYQTSQDIIISKDLQLLKPFKRLMEKDGWEKYIAYVYHAADYTSPYAVFDEEERTERLNKDLLDGKKPTKDVLEAITLYKELSITDSWRLLESARTAVRKLEKYFESVDLEMEDDPGKAAKDLIASLNNVGKLLGSLKDWETLIKKEKTEDKTRRGVRPTKYNT